MNFKSILLAVGIVACTVIMGEANPALSQVFGNRGGTSVRVGIVRSQNVPPRYYGPSFHTTPRINVVNRYGSTQFQQRPWYYYRTGPIEYYRPHNPLYRTR